MHLLVTVTLVAPCLAAAFTSYSSSADNPEASFIEAGTAPACPADLFDEELVRASCYQDWDRNGRWFMRLRSSGIPAHSYGQAYEPWDHLVKDQEWDITVPIEFDEGADTKGALQRDVDPTEFLVAAAQENRPLGMALNGVPFFSPLTAAGADTVNPQVGTAVVENDTLFDECAGSLQAESGAYGYRVMPPCLYDGSSAPKGAGYEPALAINGFEATPLDEDSPPPESPLLGFAMDGRRLYGPYDATRSLAWGLDVCNGRWEIDGLHSASAGAGVDQNRQYAYRATPAFPYLIGCDGPAGIALEVAAAAMADATTGLDRSKIGVGFLVETSPEGCPAGSFLSVDSGECEACRAGTYGKDAGTVGAGCPGLCPRGYFCPDGTATPTLRCPPGTFGAAQGMGNDFCSGECQEGYFCTSGSVAPDSNECGSMLYYCPKGSGERTLVKRGHYTTPEERPGSSVMAYTKARRVRSGQKRCEAGTYCTGGGRRPCPAGTFGSTAGLTSSECSGRCPIGSYCPEGTVEPIPCPAGYFGDEEGLSAQDCSGLCAKGHFCPAGSVSALEHACPAGRFGATRGLTDYLCAEENACARVPNVPCLASLCDPGYYCPMGSASARANSCGSGDHYCPGGSAYPTPVDVGYYSYSENSTEGGGNVGGIGESWSLVGETTRTSQAMCEPGYYCVSGMRLPCPAGTYGLSSGLISLECSGPCPAGYYCGAGLASTLLAKRCGAPRWYCPEGSSARSDVGLGNYTLGGPPDRRTMQDTCPAGSYCREGILYPCPAGTHGSISGLSSPACSGPCPSGRYCPSGTISDSNNASEIGFACPAGRYGLSGMGDDSCAGPCEAGYYCPESSSSPRELECGSGTVFCGEGSGVPTNVTAGWYAVGGGELTRSGQAECSAAAGGGSGGGTMTPPSAMSIVEVCPDNTVGWNGTAVLGK